MFCNKICLSGDTSSKDWNPKSPKRNFIIHARMLITGDIFGQYVKFHQGEASWGIHNMY